VVVAQLTEAAWIAPKLNVVALSPVANPVPVTVTLVPPADPMPSPMRAQRELMDLNTALHQIHQPDSWAMITLAKKRLKWDEAFATQVSLVQRRMRAADWPALPRPARSAGLLSAFDAALPYQLTGGQVTVGGEIAADLSAKHPMHRLLQGEVGSGKTLCALRGILQVVDAGGQAALLAPTEVLAAQHYRNIRALLAYLLEGSSRLHLDASDPIIGAMLAGRNTVSSSAAA